MVEVIWTEPAIEDLEAIADYIARDKPGAAKRLVRDVVARIERLGLFPQSGGKPRGLAGTPYRQIVVPPLKVFYRVDEAKVFVVYVMRSERSFRLRHISAREG